MIDEQRFYMRDPDVVAVGTSGHTLFVDASGKSTGIDVPDAVACSMLLRDLVEPTPGSKLREKPLLDLPAANLALSFRPLGMIILLRQYDGQMLSQDGLIRKIACF